MKICIVFSFILISVTSFRIFPLNIEPVIVSDEDILTTETIDLAKLDTVTAKTEEITEKVELSIETTTNDIPAKEPSDTSTKEEDFKLEEKVDSVDKQDIKSEVTPMVHAVEAEPVKISPTTVSDTTDIKVVENETTLKPIDTSTSSDEVKSVEAITNANIPSVEAVSETNASTEASIQNVTEKVTETKTASPTPLTDLTTTESVKNVDDDLKLLLSADLVPPKTEYKKYVPDPRYDY